MAKTSFRRELRAIKPSDILDQIKKHGVKTVEARFPDMPGRWQRTSIPASSVDEELLTGGIAFDDLLLRPDLATAHLDAFATSPAMSLICDTVDPATRAPSAKDVRAVARRAQDYLRSTGIADTVALALEAEFFILDAVAEHEPHTAARATDVRSQAALACAEWGIDVETHRGIATATSRAAIGFRSNSLLRAADDVMTLKHVVKNVAERNGTVATFMPKPLSGAGSSGLACRQSLWKDGRPLFFDANGYAECSQTMLYYIGGLLTHIAQVLAFAAPSTNSYVRLGALGDAPANVAFSTRNRSAAVRLPMVYPGSAKAKCLDFRPPDSSANPYLAFSAMLLAGIDGIKRKIDPVRAGFGPLDRSIPDLLAADAAKLKLVPASLRESLAALAGDHGFLTESGVFTKAFVDEWIVAKTDREVRPVETRTHPYEVELYRDC